MNRQGGRYLDNKRIRDGIAVLAWYCYHRCVFSAFQNGYFKLAHCLVAPAKVLFFDVGRTCILPFERYRALCIE